MLKRTSGGDNDTELNELTVAPIREPSFVTVVTTATPVGKSPRASRKFRSVKVIWRAPFLWQADSPMFVQLSRQSKRLWARYKLSMVYGTRDPICLIGHRVEPRRCGASPADRRRPAAEKALVNARYGADALVGTVPQPTKLRLTLADRGAVANLAGLDA